MVMGYIILLSVLGTLLLKSYLLLLPKSKLATELLHYKSN